MFKWINLIRKLCNILVITITFLSIFNLGWVILAKDTLYWPLYSKVANTLGFILLICLFIFIPALIWSTFKSLIRVILLIVVATGFYFEFSTTEVLNYVESTTINEKTVILSRYSLDNGSSCYEILECNTDSTYCNEAQPQLDYCAIGNPGPEAMQINETGDLNIFVDGILVYTYKVNSYKYEIEDLAFYKTYIYWAVYTQIDKGKLFLFGRCNEQRKDSCEILQKYTNPSFHNIDLEVNDSDNGLLIFYDGVLDRIEQ